MRKRQVREGKRPPAKGKGLWGKAARFTVVSANVTVASSFRRELEQGTAFAHDSFVVFQEHRLPEDRLTEAETWAGKIGWRWLGDAAYFKDADFGGGTGVLSRDVNAARLAPAPRTCIEGEFV